MISMQPLHRVFSLFHPVYLKNSRENEASAKFVLGLLGAFFVCLLAGLAFNLAYRAMMGSSDSLSAEVFEEAAAYLPSQAVSQRLNAGHYLSIR